MSGMTSYFVRRLLLIPVTFVAITFLVYCIIRLAPGGPIEQAKTQLLAQQMGEGGGRGGGLGETGAHDLPKEQIEALQRYYKLDRNYVVGYLIWLGLWPDRDKEGRFSGVLQGDLSRSFRWSEPVTTTIADRLPVSLYFGLIGFFATWLVCIPLGVQKAIQHRSIFDTATSLIVFLGYAIPGFVASLALMLMFATPLVWDLLPLGGIRSEPYEQWREAGEIGKMLVDRLRHLAIPIAGYLIGGFATMTILMKNSLLDNLGADYVRTAFAKGLSERRVIFVHALRNSLIPLAVSAGHVLSVLFAGSFLIEKTCNIRGMGLLGLDSLITRDYPVIMGVLVFTVLIFLVGNILSDLLLALVDPRVRFK